MTILKTAGRCNLRCVHCYSHSRDQDYGGELTTEQKKTLPKEVLTVDNHADGVYLYLRLLKKNPVRAAKVLGLLQMNGGNSSAH